MRSTGMGTSRIADVRRCDRTDCPTRLLSDPADLYRAYAPLGYQEKLPALGVTVVEVDARQQRHAVAYLCRPADGVGLHRGLALLIVPELGPRGVLLDLLAEVVVGAVEVAGTQPLEVVVDHGDRGGLHRPVAL